MASTKVTSAIGLETSLVLFLRIALFLGSRKYLLRSLYHDLQKLSSEPEQPIITSGHDGEVELEILPSPSTATLRPHESAMVAIKRTFHSTVSRAIFSLCFSECCTLFLLLMFQALDVLDPWTRLLNWRISLSLLLTLIVGLIPLSYSLVLSYRAESSLQAIQRPTLTRLVLTACPVGGFLFLLSFIPLPTGAPNAGISGVTLARLTVVGTVILGLLSGFGAADNAWRFFPALVRSTIKAPNDEELAVAEESLRRIRGQLVERQQEIERLETVQPNTNSSWLSKVVPNFRGENEISGTVQEIAGLKALDYQMARNLSALKQQRQDEMFAKTFSGRVYNIGGALFALYCVYRIFVAIFSLLFPSRPSMSIPSNDGGPRTDLIAVLLAYMLCFIPKVHLEHEEIAVVSRQISLILVGIIILSSVRLVLRGVAKALRVTNRSLGASLMLLMLAQLMGIYFLSTLVQLRTSFPPPLTRHDTQPDEGMINLFSTLPEYQVFGAVFDGSFLITAVVNLVARWFSRQINSTGIMDTS